LHTWFPLSEKNNPDPKPSGVRAGTLNPFSDGDPITTTEILDAFKTGRPPAVAIMCGCASREFVPKVIGVGVAAAFGIMRSPDGGDPTKQPFPSELASINALDAATAALMNGKTLEDAQLAANNALANNSAGSATSLVMDLQVRRGVSARLSLKGNGLL
jgi:hypothetical protein